MFLAWISTWQTLNCKHLKYTAAAIVAFTDTSPPKSPPSSNVLPKQSSFVYDFDEPLDSYWKYITPLLYHHRCPGRNVPANLFRSRGRVHILIMYIIVLYYIPKTRRIHIAHLCRRTFVPHGFFFVRCHPWRPGENVKKTDLIRNSLVVCVCVS